MQRSCGERAKWTMECPKGACAKSTRAFGLSLSLSNDTPNGALQIMFKKTKQKNSVSVPKENQEAWKYFNQKGDVFCSAF